MISGTQAATRLSHCNQSNQRLNAIPKLPLRITVTNNNDNDDTNTNNGNFLFPTNTT